MEQLPSTVPLLPQTVPRQQPAAPYLSVKRDIDVQSQNNDDGNQPHVHEQATASTRTWRSAIVRESPTQNLEGEAAILDSSISMSVLTCSRVHHSTSAARER